MKLMKCYLLSSMVLFAATASGAAASGKLTPAKANPNAALASKEAGSVAAPAAETAPAAEKSTKSIVPAKYGTKYRDGGSDDLANFINAQCAEGEKKEFSFAKYFELCRKNGLDEAKVKHYEGLVESKVRGGEGRARMTLRNMLATPARKQGHLVGLDDKKVKIDLPVREATGAAAKAKEDAANKQTAA